ncbi:MAG TPA: J domain-containing protein [Candidatus Limnocylindrales bacterium]|nr:J domain-containing protein [Candidatus Limnocylindrales bacterium]
MTERQAPDPYAVLGLARDATPLQVARAHRELAKRYHPDLHPGEDVTEPMRRINDAHRLLSSPIRRAEYDRAHPAAGRTSTGHWTASRRPIRPAQPTSTRTWATWRTTADETRAAPRTRRGPGEVQIPVTRRPPRIEARDGGFRDSGWAALLAGLIFLAVLLAAVVVGRLA